MPEPDRFEIPTVAQVEAAIAIRKTELRDLRRLRTWCKRREAERARQPLFEVDGAGALVPDRPVAERAQPPPYELSWREDRPADDANHTNTGGTP
jgi:hypothetical protein